MESKMTPGPWSYDGHGINALSEAHLGERIFKTCLDYKYGSRDRERAQADSQAVAAVPDLIKALRGVLHHNSAVKNEYKLPASLIGQVENALWEAGVL